MRTAAWLFAIIVTTAGLVAQQAPPRGAVLAPTIGTASISGVVVDDQDKPQPVRRVIVTLAGEGLRPSRGAITDDEGRFTIGNLPGGRFNLTVTRPAFVTSMYGAKRPGRPGTPITVPAGGNVAGLSVRIWRGAVISGVVRDDSGKSVEGIAVRAISASASSGGPLLTLSNNGATTNENGEYRIFGLQPGRYFVSAQPSSGGSQIVTMTDAAVDAVFDAVRRQSAQPNAARPAPAPPQTPVGYVPVYYPDAVSFSQATSITLAGGQEKGGMDIVLRLVPTSVVSGTVMRLDGTPAAGASIQLTEEQPDSAGAPPRLLSATSGPDGSFTVQQVTPAQYRLLVRMAQQPAAPAPGAAFVVTGTGPQLWAATTVSVSGTDLKGLTLTVEPGLTVSGRVSFDGASAKPAAGAALRVTIAPSSTRRLAPGSPIYDIGFTPGASVGSDGTFTIPSIPPGPNRLMLNSSTLDRTPWRPRSAMMGARDLLDADFDLSGNGSATLQITYTDKSTSVSGSLKTANGAPLSDVFVIAFPADRARWAPNSRRVKAVRPGADGSYSIADLPAGDYLLAAVTDIDQDDWQVAGFFDQLVPGAVKFTLVEGESRVVNLQVGR